MRKITLFVMLLVGILAGRAQSAIVGTYTGGINLTHMDGATAEMESQSVTITEVDGKFNVVFPSFNLVMGFATGEITVEDVTVNSNEDGSYSLSKEAFTISAGIMSCPSSTFSGTIYADGAVEMTVEVIQNPAVGAFTTANFIVEGVPYAGTYTGDMNLTHLTGAEAAMESQSVSIAVVGGKVNVVFPSFALMNGAETGEFTIEDVTVVDNEDGTFDLSKETFTIAAGYLSCPNSTFSGTIYEDGSVEMIVEVVQNPAMGALTSVYFYAEAGSDELPFVGAYTGNLNLTHIDETKVEMGEQSVTISEIDGKVNVVFPSFNLVTGMATGEITIEDVVVTENADGSYSLSKETVAVATIFTGSSFSCTISEGSVEMVIKVAQNPAMVMTTATFSTSNDESDDEPEVDSSVFVWGTATWNTENNVVYNGIAEFEAASLTLSYPNPTGYALNFLNVVLVEFDLYVDGAETPIKASSSAQASSDVAISYPFVEGHDYQIVVTKAQLAQANLATYTTDTLSTNEDRYEISFSIIGPELQKTIEVEAWMSLAITNQEYTKTVSEIDPAEICAALGISDISEAEMHALRPNGSYCDYMSYFDWWRDADGDFTPYNAGYNSVFGHNAYPAVYRIAVNEAADSVSYYFYDYWKVIDPEEGSTSGGSTLTRAPQTVYSNDTVNWDNGDGTFTQYRRSYRVEEGKDYVSEVMYVANMKSVVLRATLHFVSEDEWNEKTSIEQPASVAAVAEAVEYYSIAGVRQAGLQKGINIVRYADGTTRKVMVK